MKRNLLSAIFVCVTIFSMAQEARFDSAKAINSNGFRPGKWDYSLSVGSQFTSTSGYGSGLSSYVSPSVSYNVSKRFRLGGGITYINTNLFDVRSWYASEKTPGISGNFSTGIVYVNGTYLAGDRLTISGSAFKAFPISDTPLPYNPYNPISGNGAHGMNLNVDYKIGENFHIQAGFGYSSGVNPYYGNSFYQQPFQQGFGQGFGFGNPYHW